MFNTNLIIYKIMWSVIISTDTNTLDSFTSSSTALGVFSRRLTDKGAVFSSEWGLQGTCWGSSNSGWYIRWAFSTCAFWWTEISGDTVNFDSFFVRTTSVWFWIFIMTIDVTKFERSHDKVSSGRFLVHGHNSDGTNDGNGAESGNSDSLFHFYRVELVIYF